MLGYNAYVKTLVSKTKKTVKCDIEVLKSTGCYIINLIMKGSNY